MSSTGLNGCQILSQRWPGQHVFTRLMSSPVPRPTCPFIHQARTIHNVIYRIGCIPSVKVCRRQNRDSRLDCQNRRPLSFLQGRAQAIEAQRTESLKRKQEAKIESAMSSPRPDQSAVEAETTAYRPLGGESSDPSKQEDPANRATSQSVNTDAKKSSFSFLEREVRARNQAFAFASPSNSNYNLDPRSILALFAPPPRSNLQIPQHLNDRLFAYLSDLRARLEALRSLPTNSAEMSLWHTVMQEILPMPELVPNTGLPSTMNEITVSTVNGLEACPALAEYVRPDDLIVPLVAVICPAALLLISRFSLTHLPTSISALSLRRLLKQQKPKSSAEHGGNIHTLFADNIHLSNCLLEMHWTAWRDVAAMEKIFWTINSNGAVENDETKRLLLEVKSASQSIQEKKWFDRPSQLSAVTRLMQTSRHMNRAKIG